MTKLSAFGTALWMGDEGLAFTAVGATDVVTANAHGFSSADPVMVAGSGLPSGLFARTIYYARDILTNSFKLAATAGGVAINIGDGAGTVRKMATIAQVRNIGGPSLSTDTIDVTTHDSPSAVREFVAGLLDAGEFSLDLVFDYDNVTHVALLEDVADRDILQAFALRFPDLLATTWGFTGIVTKFAPSASVDGDVSASAGVKLSGAGKFS